MNLLDKNIVITGSCDRLGLSLTKAFIAKGAIVQIIARNKTKMNKVIKKLDITYKVANIIVLMIESAATMVMDHVVLNKRISNSLN